MRDSDVNWSFFTRSKILILKGGAGEIILFLLDVRV